MQKFTFQLHPKNWIFSGDDKVVFRALELADGTYLVSWKDSRNNHVEVVYSSEEVLASIGCKDWILLEKDIQL